MRTSWLPIMGALLTVGFTAHAQVKIPPDVVIDFARKCKREFPSQSANDKENWANCVVDSRRAWLAANGGDPTEGAQRRPEQAPYRSSNSALDRMNGISGGTSVGERAPSTAEPTPAAPAPAAQGLTASQRMGLMYAQLDDCYIESAPKLANEDQHQKAQRDLRKLPFVDSSGFRDGSAFLKAPMSQRCEYTRLTYAIGSYRLDKAVSALNQVRSSPEALRISQVSQEQLIQQGSDLARPFFSAGENPEEFIRKRSGTLPPVAVQIMMSAMLVKDAENHVSVMSRMFTRGPRPAPGLGDCYIESAPTIANDEQDKKAELVVKALPFMTPDGRLDRQAFENASDAQRCEYFLLKHATNSYYFDRVSRGLSDFLNRADVRDIPSFRKEQLTQRVRDLTQQYVRALESADEFVRKNIKGLSSLEEDFVVYSLIVKGAEHSVSVSSKFLKSRSTSR